MSPSTANMELVNDRIADFIPDMIEQCPSSENHLIEAQESSLRVVAALQNLEYRQVQGTQYLPDIDALFRKTGGMLDIFENVLHSHLIGESGAIEEWHVSERELLRNLSLVFDICGNTAKLLLLYNETLEAQSTVKDHAGRMAAYCSIIDGAASLKAEWKLKCKGNSFDPEPVLKLLEMVRREAKKYLMPGSSSFPAKVAQPVNDDDAPPAYDTVAGASSTSWIDEKAASKEKTSEAGKSTQTSLFPQVQKEAEKSMSSTSIQPKHVISIPRGSRQNEVVRVALAPESSRILVWSVNCVELYISGTGTRSWRLDSADGSLAKKGVPCQFKDLKCFSPDGSLVCFIVEAGLEAELVIIRVKDGRVLGKRTVIEKQCLSVCISNGNHRVALSCVSPGKLDGTIMILQFDPQLGEGQCFTGSVPKMRKVTGDYQPPSIESCFTPDDCHLVIAAEQLKPVPKSAHQGRTTRIRVFHVKDRPTMVKDWQTSAEQVLNQLPFAPTFLFPRDEETDKHKWLVAWNNDDQTDPVSFQLGDPVHQEIHMKIKEGLHSFSLRQFLGTLTKVAVWTQIRFSDDGTYTFVVRRGRRSNGKISVTRGRWEKDGLPAAAKDAWRENPATILAIGQDDDWAISGDGRFATTYNKEKARVELWSL